MENVGLDEMKLQTQMKIGIQATDNFTKLSLIILKKLKMGKKAKGISYE